MLLHNVICAVHLPCGIGLCIDLYFCSDHCAPTVDDIKSELKTSTSSPTQSADHKTQRPLKDICFNKPICSSCYGGDPLLCHLVTAADNATTVNSDSNDDT